MAPRHHRAASDVKAACASKCICRSTMHINRTWLCSKRAYLPYNNRDLAVLGSIGWWDEISREKVTVGPKNTLCYRGSGFSNRQQTHNKGPFSTSHWDGNNPTSSNRTACQNLRAAPPKPILTTHASHPPSHTRMRTHMHAHSTHAHTHHSARTHRHTLPFTKPRSVALCACKSGTSVPARVSHLEVP